MAAKKIPDKPDILYWDASYLIAWLAPGDSDHERALRLRDHLADNPAVLVTSWPTVSEAATILLYHYGFTNAQALFAALAGFTVILPTEDEYLSARRHFNRFSRDQKISFNDILSYVLIRERFPLARVLTFDADFSKMGMTVFRP